MPNTYNTGISFSTSQKIEQLLASIGHGHAAQDVRTFGEGGKQLIVQIVPVRDYHDGGVAQPLVYNQLTRVEHHDVLHRAHQSDHN